MPGDNGMITAEMLADFDRYRYGEEGISLPISDATKTTRPKMGIDL